MSNVNHLGELPEAVERAILLALGEAELLCCAELSRAPLSRAARHDEHWRQNFEKRLRSYARESSEVGSDNTATAPTYFERAVRTRHLETFRKPPVHSSEISMPVSVAQVCPASRSGGTELVFIILGREPHVALCNAHGDVLIAETPVPNASKESTEKTLDTFLLPDPAQPLLSDNEDAVETWTTPHTVESNHGSPAVAAKSCAVQQRRCTKSSKKKKSPDLSSVSPALSETVAPDTPVGWKPRAFACESTRRGAAIVSDPGCWWPPHGANDAALHAMHVDKWGEAFRGQFAVSTSLCRQASSSDEKQNQDVVLCCAVFADGRYVVAGTQASGSLVWDLAGSVAAPLTGQSAMVMQAARKEGRGPCFRCGQVGHWAKACPMAAGGGHSPTISAIDNSQSHSPTSSPSQSCPGSGKASGPTPFPLAQELGSVVAVAGTLIATPSSGDAPLVFSASKSAIVGHFRSNHHEEWTRVFSVSCPMSAILSLHSSHLAYSGSASGCHVWILCESAVALAGFGSLSIEPNSSSLHASDFSTGARSLSCPAAAVLVLQRLQALLCGMVDGRILVFSKRVTGGNSSNATNEHSCASEHLVGTIEVGDGIKCRTLGGGTSANKLSAITALAADARLPVVVSGDCQGSVKIWDTSSWQCLRTMRYFGHGAVTSLSLLVAAPLRGIAITTGKTLHLAWFGHKPAPICKPSHATSSRHATDQKGKKHIENPGKASTYQDWRGVRANTRKKDIGYGDPTYQHRGAGRKERRDLGARVKAQTQGHQQSGVGIVGSSGGRSAPLFDSVDTAVLRTGTTQISQGPANNANGTSHWSRVYDDDEAAYEAWQAEEEAYYYYGDEADIDSYQSREWR